MMFVFLVELEVIEHQVGLYVICLLLSICRPQKVTVEPDTGRKSWTSSGFRE